MRVYLYAYLASLHPEHKMMRYPILSRLVAPVLSAIGRGADMDARLGGHPWLNAMLVQLRRLAADDLEMMMMKEVVFASAKMSRRLVAREEMAVGIDETNSPMPSYLRKKVSEGRGRDKP